MTQDMAHQSGQKGTEQTAQLETNHIMDLYSMFCLVRLYGMNRQ